MKSLGPLLAIRADASLRSGTGHVMRTLAIAQIWMARGGQVLYICCQIPEALEQRLLTTGAKIIRIDSAADATETSATATSHKAAILLVDHYDLSESWWLALPASRRWKTVVLNDFAVPIHPHAEIRISPRAAVLPAEPHSGPDFLLIRQEIRRSAPLVPAAPKATKLLLVLGGADPENAGPVAAAAILKSAADLSLRAIVGPAASNLSDFLLLARDHPRLEVVHCPESMHPHFEWADTAVVSPSTTAFEALHHGLATGLILTAGNQEEVAADLTRQHCAAFLADARQPGWQLDPAAFLQLTSSETFRNALSQCGAMMVDGRGADRICDLLGLPEISLRPATMDEARLTWEWANDPETRSASFSSDPIPWETHSMWFEKRTTSPDPIWLAVDAVQRPLALIRLDATDSNIHTISLNIAPLARGHGLSALIVTLAVTTFRQTHPDTILHAWIKESNTASRQCFAKAGFHPADDAGSSGRLLYILLP
jgi:UDP-2,4-diacetamido-2,4,6-trideoxy-beta-L-altropyranose hydrolase